MAKKSKATAAEPETVPGPQSSEAVPADVPEEALPQNTTRMRAHFTQTLHLVLDDGAEFDLPATEDGYVDAPPEAVEKLLAHRLASHIA